MVNEGNRSKQGNRVAVFHYADMVGPFPIYFFPIFGSVPAIRRLMFSRWR